MAPPLPSSNAIRIGQIVPSSNTTMETEIPAMLYRHDAASKRGFTFHSSRMRMSQVTRQELAAMDADSLRCAAELSDARVDVMGYACLVAIMSMGHGYHRESGRKLQEVIAREGADAAIISSAGALIEGLNHLRAKKISIITPYMQPLTQAVVEYLEAEGFSVQDAISLEIPDNLEVGRRDPQLLFGDVDRLDLRGIDAVVLSACVQMPSFPVLQDIEDRIGLPVTSASACTVRAMLNELGLAPHIPGGGKVLA